MMLRTERNFQLEIFGLLANIFLIVSLKLSTADAAIIILCCFVVLTAEIFNTAIEKFCDMIQPDFDQRIKFIKDTSAGAVLLLALASVLVAFLIYPKYLGSL